jgi:hypothetical protein
MMKNFILCFLTFVIATVVHARFKTVVSDQMVTEVDQRKARGTAIEQATTTITLDMIKKEIGEARFNENQKQIENEVIPLKNRFIPFFKILSSQKEGEGYQFKIEVKVSRQDLRQVLQQKGLFASAEKTGITLPFLEVNNALTGESFRWWQPDFAVSKDLESLSLNFEKEMFQGFLDRGLFMLRPQAFHMTHMVPDFMRKTYLTQTEMVQLTNLKQGQLYLDGRVDVISSPLRENALRVRVQVKCKQSSNGKNVAEVVRTLDTPTGQGLSQIATKVSEMARETGLELANQVYDLWQRGALEAQVLQLAVTGDLDHMQLLRLKRELNQTLGLSNGLTERLYEPGRVTFETDYSGGVESLSQKLRTAKFDGFISQVVSSEPDQITLAVKVAN